MSWNVGINIRYNLNCDTPREESRGTQISPSHRALFLNSKSKEMEIQMAKLDALAEKFYKLIHRITGDTVSDASAVAGMSINEVCDKLQEEIGNGNLDPVDELAELADVALETPSNGQVLTYDGTTSKWKNAEASGGGSFIVTITESSGTYSADKTLAEIATAYAAGLVPIAKFEADGVNNIYQLSQIDNYAVFTFAVVDQYGFIASSFFVWGDGSANRETVYYTPTNDED